MVNIHCGFRFIQALILPNPRSFVSGHRTAATSVFSRHAWGFTSNEGILLPNASRGIPVASDVQVRWQHSLRYENMNYEGIVLNCIHWFKNNYLSC